LFFVLIGA